MPRPYQFKSSSPEQLEKHNKQSFKRIVEHATKKQPDIRHFSVFDSALQFWSIGCPDEWTFPNGYDTFRGQFKRKLPTRYHEYARISHNCMYSPNNLKVALSAKYKSIVVGMVRGLIDKHGSDLEAILAELNAVNCPSETTASMSLFALEAFIAENNIKPTPKAKSLVSI